MAWTTVRKTPLLWTLYEDVGGGTTSEINTEGYDMALFVATTQGVQIQAKVDTDANGSQDAWVVHQADTAVHKVSASSGSAATTAGYCRAPLPSIIRLKDADGTSDVGNVYVELRRTAAWDRGN